MTRIAFAISLQKTTLRLCYAEKKTNKNFKNSLGEENYKFSRTLRKLMGMKQFLLYSVFFVLLAACGTKRPFTAQENQAYQDLQDLVASRSFEIVSSSANPVASASFSRVANSNILGPGSNASSIDISTNSNRLTIKGDTIKGYLPFFGDQHFGGSYGGTHTGIEFNGTPRDYRVINDDKKRTVEIQFKIDDKYRNSDHYTMMITLYANHRSSIRVQSTARSTIEYTGRVSKLVEVKD